MAKSRGTQKRSERAALRLFDKVMTCEPLMSREDAKELDRLMSGAGTWAVVRRIGLALASSGGDWFKQVSEDRHTAVVIAGQLEAVRACAAALRELAGVIDAGATRVEIALCNHEDFQQIMTESKAAAYMVFGADAGGTAGAAA
jgi:hypothetical protein